MNSNKASIIVGGDIVPTESNYSLFEKGDVRELLGDALLEKWHGADLRIINLEAPITDSRKQISKSGPALKIPTSCTKGIKELGIDVCSLANNHIKDYGEEGILETIQILRENGICLTGAGQNLQAASKPAILNANGIKIGIYSCAEHEYSASDKKTSGANVLGINTSLDIYKLKSDTDYVIVLFHGGKEHFPYPTRKQKERCETMVDAGADIVICQHSHCVGCKEEYNGKTIVYGQGNFLFDYKDDDCWNSGLLLNIELERFDDSISVKIDYIPLERMDNKVRLAGDNVSTNVLDGFVQRSEQIKDDIARNRIYDELSMLGRDNLYYYAGFSRIMRGIDKRILKRSRIDKHYNLVKKKELLGILQCETHREITEEYLRNHLE